VIGVSGYRRCATVALGGIVLAAGAMLGGAPIGWAEPDADAVNAINDRYAVFGGEGSLLGAPLGKAVDVPGGAAREFAGGAIYYSPDTGAHVMYGAILDRYTALGGPAASGLGFPRNDESDTGDGTGRFNDFSATEGASIYWTPQWGASVIKSRVLEAWRQSGGVTGPFGYPSADTSIVDGVQTGKFTGPEGTEIQWSQAAGLVTIPAGLAATIAGFGTAAQSAAPTEEGKTPVTKPTLSGPAAPEAPTKTSKWWWIPVGIAVAALLGGLLRLLTRKPESAPVAPAVDPEVRKAPPPPPRPAPVADTPKTVAPPAKAPAAKPVSAPAPRPVNSEPPKRPVNSEPPKRSLLSEPPKATIRPATTEPDLSPVVRYENQSPPETTIRVTYENNAVGDNQKSAADKSDSVPDSQQL